MVNRLTDQVFYIRENDDWVLKRTQDIFNDKEVVVFGLPGAFTPTCSAFQLPKFEELYDTFKDLGIDEVYCTSVNDSFVMNAWFEQQGITKVKAFPSSNSTLYFEQASNQLDLLSKNNLFSIPIILIGLDCEIDKKQKIVWSEYKEARYSRESVNSKLLELEVKQKTPNSFFSFK